MYIEKNFSFTSVMRFSGGHILWLTVWMCFVTAMHHFFHDYWIEVPWLPVSVIGTAVAFYVGFKNNQAYDRLWEARKIWGAIVNSSRAWGSAIKGFVSNQFTNENYSKEALTDHHRRLIYRHVAWLYTLRNQLLIPTSWEHINQGKHIARTTKARRKRWGIGLLEDDLTENILKDHLPVDEYDRLINYKNTATQIIDQQAQDLKNLRALNLIDDFRHMELQKILYDFYVHQGKAERIKKFPLPRQYGSMSFIFIGIFIFLLPFSMVTEFHDLGKYGSLISVPISVLIGWVYVMMELVGDYSENPFEGLGNDIPMLALSRTIEIDLKEMLQESEIPEGIKPVNGVLM